MENISNRSLWILVPGAVFLSCLVICACIGFSGFLGYGIFSSSKLNETGLGTQANTPVVVRPTPDDGHPGSGLAALSSSGKETLETLQETKVPISDLRELSKRFHGRTDIPAIADTYIQPLKPGVREEFWVSNVDSNKNRRITATLVYVTDHVYFWVGEGIDFDNEAVETLVETFENEIYPTTRDYFGSEWTPGIDGDPHLYLLYVDDLGRNLAGYFSSTDELHPLAHPYSNGHEMFLLNSDNLRLDEEFTFGVLAHEFQHMIHWQQDRNEASWVNEGLSELAAFLNGYEVGSDYSYIRNTDIQLNDWPDSPGRTAPHYGAAFLFFTYLLDRFGETLVEALVAEPENGLEGVDQVLDNYPAGDPSAEEQLTAEDLFMDWVLASYLKDEKVGDGRYTYHVYPEAPQANATELIEDCPLPLQVRDVSQFGVDYIRITCPGSHTLRFQGSVQAKVLPEDPHSGKYAFWSNRGDEADMTLTREFDFRGYSGPLTLTYWTWYDLEEDYDYVYLSASEDLSQWDILMTPSGTAEDPSGNSFGWGYNGDSDGWIQESVDLSRYAGKIVYLRFEYVTDAAVTGDGMLVDDIAIPEIGYFQDAEKGFGGWEASGWVRIQNLLPQTFRLALISINDGKTTVEHISVESDVSAEIPLTLERNAEAVLVVSGTSRYTRQKAAYQFEVLP
jgi:hypothetical protein